MGYIEVQGVLTGGGDDNDGTDDDNDEVGSLVRSWWLLTRRPLAG